MNCADCYTWGEALAWSNGSDRNDTYRHHGIAERQKCRLDGKGRGRGLPPLTSAPCQLVARRFSVGVVNRRGVLTPIGEPSR
jgi:hypothetical protein